MDSDEQRRRQAEALSAGARSSKWAARLANLQFWVLMVPVVFAVVGFLLVAGLIVAIALPG